MIKVMGSSRSMTSPRIKRPYQSLKNPSPKTMSNSGKRARSQKWTLRCPIRMVRDLLSRSLAPPLLRRKRFWMRKAKRQRCQSFHGRLPRQSMQHSPSSLTLASSYSSPSCSKVIAKNPTCVTPSLTTKYYSRFVMLPKTKSIASARPSRTKSTAKKVKSNFSQTTSCSSSKRLRKAKFGTNLASISHLSPFQRATPT